MPQISPKKQRITYLGIGVVLLLGIFVADRLVPGFDLFQNKNAMFQSAGKNTENTMQSGNRVVIDAPPQPQPVANRPQGAGTPKKPKGIKHNYRLLPTWKKGRDMGNWQSDRTRTVVYKNTAYTEHETYAGRFRIAQNRPGQEQSQSRSKSQSQSSDGQANNTKGNGDKPAYFDAPTVQPSQQSTTQATKGTSASGKEGLVVVRNTDMERKLESKLQAGKRAMRMARYDAALSFFNELYKDYQDEPRVLMGRAVALQQLGRNQAAKNTYQALLENDPDNVQAKINMYGIIQNSKPGLALRKLKALREDHSDNSGLAAQIGFISANIGKYEQASKYLQIAASIAPSNPQHFYNLGIVEEHKGNSKKAVKYYEKAVDKISVRGESGSLSKEKIYDRLAVLRDS